MLRNFANGIAIFIDATEIITVIYPIRKMIPKIGEINMLELAILVYLPKY